MLFKSVKSIAKLYLHFLLLMAVLEIVLSGDLLVSADDGVEIESHGEIMREKRHHQMMMYDDDDYDYGWGRPRQAAGWGCYGEGNLNQRCKKRGESCWMDSQCCSCHCPYFSPGGNGRFSCN